MTRRGDYVSWRRHSAGQIHGQNGSGVYFLATCFSAEFSLRSGRSVPKCFALKVIQSALLPGITNLVFQRFHPLAALPEWMFAPMLDSMPAQYDLPTAYPEPGPPIRRCTS